MQHVLAWPPLIVLQKGDRKNAGSLPGATVVIGGPTSFGLPAILPCRDVTPRSFHPRAYRRIGLADPFLPLAVPGSKVFSAKRSVPLDTIRTSGSHESSTDFGVFRDATLFIHSDEDTPTRFLSLQHMQHPPS